MRPNTTRIVLPLLAALAATSCKKESVEGPAAVCMPVSYSCSSDAQCCSYGCVVGSCRQNPLEGGACRTSDDCQYPRVCVDEQCTSSVACRNGASSCVYDGDCCSGDCAVGGQCTNDLPPVAQAGANVLPDQPFRIAIRLDGSASTDPNTGAVGLLYEWTVLSAPPTSTAAPGPSGVVNPTFTPDVADAVVPYVIELKVTKGALSSTDTVTFKAIDTPPVITMPADVLAPAYQSRNVALAFSATVSDLDGGPVTCSWSKTSPTGVVTAVVAPYACAGASGATAIGTTPYTLDEDEAGSWRLTLTASDGVHTVTKDRFVNVENDPPVANAGPRRYGNYALGAIPLAGTATDVNDDVTGGNLGDATFTWLWTVTARPAGSAINLGTVLGATPSVSFTPDAEGVFQLTLTADDGHGGPNGDSSTSTVQVQVDPYILPLGEVVDAEYVDGTNQIVVVETGPGNAHALKIVDPTTLTVVDEVALSARPTCVGLNPLGTEALVGEAGGLFERITGISATPSLAVATTVPSGSAMPADLADVVHAGLCAFGVSGAGTVYELIAAAPGAPYFLPVACPTCTTGTNEPLGMRASATASSVWFLQTGTGRLGRYDIHTNCNLQNALVRTYGTLPGTAGLWRSVDDADLYTTRSTVYSALDLTSRITSLPLTPDHLDTTLGAGGLVGAVARNATTALSTFSRASVGATFVAGSDVAYPILGFNGDALSNYGRFAFVRTGGGAYFAIVRANVGTVAAPVFRWGVVNLGP